MPLYVEYYPNGDEDCYVYHGTSKPDSGALNTNAILFESNSGNIMPSIERGDVVTQYITHSKQAGNNVYNVVFEKPAGGSYFKFENGDITTTSILPTAEPSSFPLSPPVGRSSVSSVPSKPSSTAISYPTLQAIQTAIAEIQPTIDTNKDVIYTNFDSSLHTNPVLFKAKLFNSSSSSRNTPSPLIIKIIQQLNISDIAVRTYNNLNSMYNTIILNKNKSIETTSAINQIINTIGNTINTLPGIPQNIKVPLAQLFSYIVQFNFINA